jgi:NTE family protein
MENIILEGGGVKGVAYAGVYQALSEEGIVPKRIGGASAGAIAAALIAIGYDSEEVHYTLWNKDFSDFEDTRWAVAGLWNVVSKYGWHSGKTFESWFAKLMQNKGLGADLTFESLRDRCLGPELYLKGTNISRGESVTFCAEDTPNFPVLKAIRISMSIPFFFTSVTVGGDYYGDGGILNNYPIRMFDREPFTNGGLNEGTVGFRLDSEKEFKKPTPYSTTNLFYYSIAILKGLYNATQSSHLKPEDWERTIRINTGDIGAIDFDMSTYQKQYLYDTGYKTTKQALKGRK